MPESNSQPVRSATPDEWEAKKENLKQKITPALNRLYEEGYQEGREHELKAMELFLIVDPNISLQEYAELQRQLRP